MGWFRDAVQRGVKRGIEDAVESGAFRESIDQIVREMLAKPEYAFFRFIKHIQAEMMRVDPKLPAREAMRLAKGVYNQHLKDEKCAFGDERYAWDKGAAIELAHAYEIDHWEQTS